MRQIKIHTKLVISVPHGKVLEMPKHQKILLLLILLIQNRIGEGRLLKQLKGKVWDNLGVLKKMSFKKETKDIIFVFNSGALHCEK